MNKDGLFRIKAFNTARAGDFSARKGFLFTQFLHEELVPVKFGKSKGFVANLKEGKH
jgi:hypothetical protein